MKKTVVSLLLLLIFLPTVMLADGYTELWNKVYEAAKKDLPKTQLEYLDRIITRAEADRDYGQLLKAEWRSLWTCSSRTDGGNPFFGAHDVPVSRNQQNFFPVGNQKHGLQFGQRPLRAPLFCQFDGRPGNVAAGSL